MPTTRPRLTITETEEIARALDEAAARWPHISSRRELLLRLVEEGRAALAHDDDELVVARRDAIARTKGVLSGAYEPDYLARLREDWPA
jgi:hypothetical protein